MEQRTPTRVPRLEGPPGRALELEILGQEFSPWEGDPWIDFAPTDDTLRQFAADLDVALARFPER